MKALIQRVVSSSVEIDGNIVGKIGKGLLIFLGISVEDSEKEVMWLVDKCANLRIFEDEHGKMNRSLIDIKGEALIISQFTLYGDSLKGRRPSFIKAARPEQAIPLYEKFICEFRKKIAKVETGEFGADMLVDIKNDGPVTLMVETP